ncbi:probable polypeptide N-acetylgalactosaminyltransferase 8 [Salmo trutta]|uniref:probable polypeptide N-acetylgalactosaminyltransferase 8 n=1 Tax=Salmo trutta TaxID=8032 RepID=UPI00112FFFB0|nr:probable polypeptide N-acetylgalactosaminyltransferase 8 [Salmo trutta]
MRLGWVRGLAPLLAMAAGILYITSIKREVHSHGERLQRAHQNDSVRGQDILKRLEKMEAHIEKLLKTINNEISLKEGQAVKAPEVKKERKVVKKVYPNSALFTSWGDELSEEEQKEAEGLFQMYGYNAFLSDRLPLNRELPDTRDPK